MKSCRIVRHANVEVRPRTSAEEETLRNDVGVCLSRAGMLFGHNVSLPRPALELIEDPTDTWSHGADRYSSVPLETAVWHAFRTVDQGPLMASRIENGSSGKASEFTAEWRVYAGEPYVSLDLQVNFQEKHKVLKLTFPLPGGADQRIDGIFGGFLTRPSDGGELPLRDWSLIGPYGIVCPDVYAVEATASCL